MRKVLFVAAACIALPAGAQEVELESPRSIVSYGIGLQLAQNLMQQGLSTIDSKALALALEDVMAGRQPRVSIADLQNAQQALQAQLAQEKEAQGVAAKAEGEAFLATNGERDGVTTLDTGLQYLEVTAGEGETPTETDTVVVHYTGKLLDGRIFDSSHQRGEPAEFGVGQVIPGWQQALQLMKVGSKWEIWIPSDLAYGPRGAGALIGPNATLHFEVELLSIKE